MWPVILLICSNVFMTIAWYGHLRFFPGHSTALPWIILVSWLIALPEYCLAVPANRIGTERGFDAAELKTIQEIVTLIVFAIFSVVVLKQKLAWNHLAGFACIAAAGLFIFNPFARKPPPAAHTPPTTTPSAEPHS